MATPQQLLAQAGRPARQDLSGAANGTIQGANGGTQTLGTAAMRRLGQGGGGQTPGIVPPMPPAGGGGPIGYTGPGGSGVMTPSGGDASNARPWTNPTGTPAQITPFPGGPQSLGGQNVQQAIDIYNNPSADPNAVRKPGAGAGVDPGYGPMQPGPGGNDQLQSMIAHEQPQPGMGRQLPSGGDPGGQSGGGGGMAGMQPGGGQGPMATMPGAGGVNGAGGGPGPSTFNLPGFKPVNPENDPRMAIYVQAMQAAGAGNNHIGGTMNGSQPQDPNAMRQALGAMPAMMNNVAKTPDVATSPFGQAPGQKLPEEPGGSRGGGMGMAGMTAGGGQGPMATPGSPGGPGGSGKPGFGQMGIRGGGGASPPWAPAGGGGGKGGGFQLRGFKPKPKGPAGLDSMTGGEVAQPAANRQGRQNMKPSMGEF